MFQQSNFELNEDKFIGLTITILHDLFFRYFFLNIEMTASHNTTLSSQTTIITLNVKFGIE